MVTDPLPESVEPSGRSNTEITNGSGLVGADALLSQFQLQNPKFFIFGTLTSKIGI